jgi:hypothetical protein
VRRIGIVIIGGIELLVCFALAVFAVFCRYWLGALAALAFTALMAFKLWDDLRIEKERKK